MDAEPHTRSTLGGKAMNPKVSLRSLLFAATAVVALITGPAVAETKIIRFDVADDATRFAFDKEQFVFEEGPGKEDNLPAYGNQFVTQGYIYPPGTLTASTGVFENGDPEFPDLVIGEWTCRTLFIGDGAKTVTGPWVITTQFYDLGDGHTVISEGLELADINVPITRAITGGTAPFKNASGKAVQTLLGFNVTEGVNLRFVLKVDDFRADLLQKA
jgi:hypothetical protein